MFPIKETMVSSSATAIVFSLSCQVPGAFLRKYLADSENKGVPLFGGPYNKDLTI